MGEWKTTPRTRSETERAFRTEEKRAHKEGGEEEEEGREERGRVKPKGDPLGGWKEDLICFLEGESGKV